MFHVLYIPAWTLQTLKNSVFFIYQGMTGMFLRWIWYNFIDLFSIVNFIGILLSFMSCGEMLHLFMSESKSCARYLSFSTAIVPSPSACLWMSQHHMPTTHSHCFHCSTQHCIRHTVPDCDNFIADEFDVKTAYERNQKKFINICPIQVKKNLNKYLVAHYSSRVLVI